MSSLSKVCFFFEYSSFSLLNRKKLKCFIESIFQKEKKKLVSLNFIFCSDKKLLEINQQFLRHDYFTDIITFDLSQSSSIQAEIYISVERVRDNAKTMGVPFKEELHRVIFHGVLHLCGYNDKGQKEVIKMRGLENFHLSRYFE
jgi:probable rRNA maturation factor